MATLKRIPTLVSRARLEPEIRDELRSKRPEATRRVS
jgi:hypothetical protein